jgi:hypothetical protein
MSLVSPLGAHTAELEPVRAAEATARRAAELSWLAERSALLRLDAAGAASSSRTSLS